MTAPQYTLTIGTLLILSHNHQWWGEVWIWLETTPFTVLQERKSILNVQLSSAYHDQFTILGALPRPALSGLMDIVFPLVIDEEKYTGKRTLKLFFQLAYVGVQHLAPSAAIHRRSRTRRLESLIRDVHHCVGFCMQTSLSASACVICDSLTSFEQKENRTEMKLSSSAAWNRLNSSH